jgi:hypothetical protein
MKRSKLARRKMSIPTYKMGTLFILLFGPVLLSKLINLSFLVHFK